MIAISEEYVNNVIDKFSNEINTHWNQAKDKLEKISVNDLNDDEKEYLKWSKEIFIDNVDWIKFSPAQMANFVESDEFKSVPIINKDGKEEDSKLKKIILEALGYTKLRSEFYPKYFQAIGIKACVYCNSNLAVSANRIDNDGNETVRAKFQVDHYYPKSKYPLLSISLFNLYPSCASCNNVKHDKRVKFSLYSNDEDEINNSKFSFNLLSFSKAKHLLNRSDYNIDFEFVENEVLDSIHSTFQATFDIKGIYDTQKDVILDLIDKSLVYDFHYKKSLNENFPKLFLTKEHFENFIIGNYSRQQDIHKRPMSKFMQDIARDLGIID